MADRGSILMDEIGELSPPNQTALLRVIEYGTFRPVGAVKELETDVRIIAATNRNLEQAVATKEFRKDLYYRLKGLTLDIPPLRERRADIPLLAEYFLGESAASGRTKIGVSSEALSVLVSYNWPGNVRELRHVIELAALFAIEEGEIKPRHLPEEIRKTKVSDASPGPEGVFTTLRLGGFVRRLTTTGSHTGQGLIPPSFLVRKCQK